MNIHVLIYAGNTSTCISLFSADLHRNSSVAVMQSYGFINLYHAVLLL